jgi:hypothetical protein
MCVGSVHKGDNDDDDDNICVIENFCRTKTSVIDEPKYIQAKKQLLMLLHEITKIVIEAGHSKEGVINDANAFCKCSQKGWLRQENNRPS